MWAASASGARYHFPTGSNAQLRSAPESADGRRFTNLMH